MEDYAEFLARKARFDPPTGIDPNQSSMRSGVFMQDMRLPRWISGSETKPFRCKYNGRRLVIYALFDPRTNEVRYIGKTSQTLSARLSGHLREKSQCHRKHWIDKLRAVGLTPKIAVIETVMTRTWQEAEIEWIAHFRSNGARLTNNTLGGDGVPGLPDETRERMRLVWIGRKHSAEACAKIGASKRGVVASAETRAKMSAAHKGRKIYWVEKIAESTRKLSASDCEDIKLRLSDGEKVMDLAEEYCVHRTTLSKVKMGTYLVFGQGGKSN